ncbi:MAG: 16S rRNA (cytosine(967)-C(5))-methyltransferase RsmB [Geobacteraceae bacterium]|nr:16S rRNA (cytosine(967)-C(5))-methyltransferase RsmB [Geobacteraceae bacterium]
MDYILKGLTRQPFAKLEIPVRTLLRLGAYQIMYLDRVPAHAAVHSCVELARSMNLERATGFLNGILRNLVRQEDTLAWPDRDIDPQGYITHALSMPAWIAQRWMAQYGVNTAIQLAEFNTRAAPNTLRVNTLKTTRAQMLQQFADAGVEAAATEYAPDGIMVKGSAAAQREWLHRGLFQPQDEASMLVGHLLQVQPGQRILDVCAAPGGKTCHIATLGQNEVEIVALDLHQHRLQQLQDGAQRLGCRNITTLCHDMTTPYPSGEDAPFDTVLVDAPCSGLGVLRRNPELRWRRREQDIAELAGIQRRILHNAGSCVAPGGKLVYSLCTTTPEESSDVVEDFLQHNPDFFMQNLHEVGPAILEGLIASTGYLTTLSTRDVGMDCFFAAVLRRKSGI